MMCPRKEGGIRLIVVFVSLALALFLPGQEAAAVDKEEIEAEIQKVAQEDPELAGQMQHELDSAIRTGEIEVQEQDEGKIGERAEIDWETPEGRAKAAAEIDSHKEDLLKQGLTEGDIDKLKELVASGDHDPEKFKEIFEKDGRPIFEGGREGEFFKEGMEQGDYGREMMERMMREVAGREEGDMMREYGVEHELTAQEKADKEVYEQAMREGDRETMERMMREYEGREQVDRETFEREMREHGEREFTERDREVFEREYAERERELPPPGEYREPPPGFEPPPQP